MVRLRKSSPSPLPPVRRLESTLLMGTCQVRIGFYAPGSDRGVTTFTTRQIAGEHATAVVKVGVDRQTSNFATHNRSETPEAHAAKLELCLLDCVKRIELGNASPATGNPAEHVDRPRIGDAAEGIYQHFRQQVGEGVLKVIEDGIHDHAVNAIDILLVAFVKRELNVRFAEFDLVVASRRSWMETERRRGEFWRILLHGLIQLLY